MWLLVSLNHKKFVSGNDGSRATAYVVKSCCGRSTVTLKVLRKEKKIFCARLHRDLDRSYRSVTKAQ
jgi:hypothetical protein